MAAPSLLIAGRGSAALFAARLAAVRGYRTTLLLDPDPAPLALHMGSGGGVLSRLEAEAGAALSPCPTASLSLPPCLFLGPPARYLGAPRPSVPASPEEEERFFFGIDAALSSSVFPELERRMELSHQKTSTVPSLFWGLSNWFLEPEREKERLPRKIAREAKLAIAPAEGLLSALLPFAGLFGRRPDHPEALRLFMNMKPSRMLSLPPQISLPSAPNDVLFFAGKRPPVLASSGHGRHFRLSGEDRDYDRVLLMTESPSVPLVSGVCDITLSALPALWPSIVLLSSPEGGGSLLLLDRHRDGDRSRGWLWGSCLHGQDPGRSLLAWVDLWNAQTLLPVLDRLSLVRRETSPLLEGAEDLTLRAREKTVHLKTDGHLSCLVDPTLLPLVSEDFWADLSLALPARRKGNGQK